MADGDRPLLNPVLKLQMEPAPETHTGGGKGRTSVVQERLPQQQRVLSAASRALFASRAELPRYGGRTHLIARMFVEDSLAPTHTPDDLFGPLLGCQLVAPVRNGYLIEADVDALPRLTSAIEHPASFALQADISRVKTLSAFQTEDRLRGRSVDDLWNAAIEEDGMRLFVLWLAPFHNAVAQDALLNQIEALVEHGVVQPTYSAVRLLAGPAGGVAPVQPLSTPRQSSVARAMRSYRNTGSARATIRVSSAEQLATLVSSGASYRIDPVRPVRVASPGTGQDPVVPYSVVDAPIVAVVDGGLDDPHYANAEAWRAPSLVPDGHADRNHGNGVSSLVVQAHAWNANRLLPALSCRVGTVQAVPRRNSNHPVEDRDLVDYLTVVVRAHPEARVWNISANQEGPGFDPDEVSALGHDLGLLARSANILPVISIGNVGPHNKSRPNPPADCEAAIVVGGREADKDGKPGNGCPVCLTGPGPDGMMKPDVSWFSELRMGGGVIDRGSSYATPLVSSVAAHTFANLRDPTPDLVKALLINASEREEHDPRLGWGTPFNGHLPWACEPGSVTLAWRAQLEPGAAYYWNGIPVPPEMIKNGKLCGRARLTAILRPLVSPYGGANYFATRLETSLQYQNGTGEWKGLLGSMMESSLKELDARKELRKWQPIRRHCEEFSSIGFTGNHFRLYARVYTRDLYQFGWTHHSQAGAQEVSFVLTFSASDNQASIYNSTAQALGNFVESAVVNQDIVVGH